jgi:hypothetical protein
MESPTKPQYKQSLFIVFPFRILPPDCFPCLPCYTSLFPFFRILLFHCFGMRFRIATSSHSLVSLCSLRHISEK